jgi:hypothetical protein
LVIVCEPGCCIWWPGLGNIEWNFAAFAPLESDSKRTTEVSMSRNLNKTEQLTESGLAQDKMGDNSLQGNDQSNVRNQRQAVPDVKQEPDSGVIESLKNMDKDVRAKNELGKGARKQG